MIRLDPNYAESKGVLDVLDALITERDWSYGEYRDILSNSEKMHHPRSYLAETK